MKSFLQSKYAHWFFQISTAIKGIDGILEVIGGFLLLLVSNTMLNGIVIFFTEHELVEDPHDLVANAAINLVRGLSSATKFFAALYLLVHGIVKIFLVIHLLRE